MKICFVTNGYPPEDGGGIGTYVYNLAHSLTKLGHSVCVLTKGSQDKIWQDKSIKVYQYRFRYLSKVEILFPNIRWSHFVAKRLSQIDAEEKFDIIEFPNWEGVGYCYLTFVNKKPSVTRLHTGYFETFQIDSQQKKSTAADKFTFWLEKRSVQKSKFILASAVYHKNLIESEYALNVNKIDVIPLGCELPDLSAKKKSSETINILCVGRLEHRKGTINLIDVIPEILRKFNNVKFNFVGKDRAHAPGGLTFEQYFNEQYPELKKSVNFYGYVPYEKVHDIYCTSDLFVLPSLCENFGIVYIEAMSFALPVIGSNVTAIPEVVSHNKTGMLINPLDKVALRDSIIKLVEDKELRIDMGKQGRAWVEKHFLQETIARKTVDYFQKVINSSVKK